MSLTAQVIVCDLDLDLDLDLDILELVQPLASSIIFTHIVSVVVVVVFCFRQCVALTPPSTTAQQFAQDASLVQHLSVDDVVRIFANNCSSKTLVDGNLVSSTHTPLPVFESSVAVIVLIVFPLFIRWMG